MGQEVLLAQLPVESTNGALQLPTGTTAQRPATPVQGHLRYNTTIGGTEVYNGSSWVAISARDGTSASRAALKTTDILAYNPSAATGWYWVLVNNVPTQLYIDNSFSGGGWVLTGSHPINVSFPTTGYATLTTGKQYVGSSGFTIGTSDPKAYATMLPLQMWIQIANANGLGNRFIQMTAGSQVELNNTGAHQRRSSWNWTGWASLYAWTGVSGLSNDVGGTTPGLYTYATTPYNFSAYDADNDTYSGNCPATYNNAPWWYNACWDGNFWGGNGSGYQNATFWTGSGSDYYNYGAWYVR
jgi:hypothetical protein